VESSSFANGSADAPVADIQHTIDLLAHYIPEWLQLAQYLACCWLVSGSWWQRISIIGVFSGKSFCHGIQVKAVIGAVASWQLHWHLV